MRTTVADLGDARRPEQTKPPSTSRNAGIDALRASLTLLVVFHHAAITYGAQGSWFYIEIEPSKTASSIALTLFSAYNQAFFMGLFFLIAGSLTPPAIARRGAAGFLRERLIRLGLPLVVFTLVLGPLTVALAQTAHGRRFFAVLGWLAAHGVIIPGPMWFVEALLIFSAAYVALRATVGPAFLERVRPFPSNRALAVAALATGATAFLLRLRWPVGWEVLALQFGYFASYICLVLRRLPRRQWRLARERAG
jgi:peptidoglycan/LPS O-acetylase OafA/YrhL